MLRALTFLPHANPTNDVRRGSEKWKESHGKKTKLMLFIVVFGLSHGCSGWWGFELYTTRGSTSVFVCVGI